MTRILLAICLSLGAGLVMAAPSSSTNDSTDQECPRVTAKAAIAAQANAVQPAAQVAPAAAPQARTRNGGGGTTRMVSPRWHSLLPGMFR